MLLGGVVDEADAESIVRDYQVSVSVCETMGILSRVFSFALCHSQLKLPIPMQIPVFSSLSEAFADTTEWDGVVISSPTPTHAHLIREAADQGLPIFTEKPVAEDAPRIQELFDYASHCNVPLC